MTIRGKAELISDTKFRFTCPAGHVSTKDFAKGPIAKRMGAWGCKKMEQWWRDSGVSYDCKKCNS
jgi:hypothetical protein